MVRRGSPLDEFASVSEQPVVVGGGVRKGRTCELVDVVRSY
jgi:hypothetical protein